MLQNHSTTKQNLGKQNLGKQNPAKCFKARLPAIDRREWLEVPQEKDRKLFASALLNDTQVLV